MILEQVKINEIISYFENHYDFDFTEIKYPIQLQPMQRNTNLKNFLYNHISILKKNSGNPVYLLYYERLLKVYYISKL